MQSFSIDKIEIVSQNPILDPKLQSAEPKELNVVKVEKYMLNELKGKLVLVVKAASVVATHLTSKLGEPVSLEKAIADPSSLKLDKQVEIPPQEKKVVEEVPTAHTTKQQKEVVPSPAKEQPKVVEEVKATIQDTESNEYTPIKCLTTFSQDWTIKARITSKQKRPTRNNGHILKIELLDNHGT